MASMNFTVQKTDTGIYLNTLEERAPIEEDSDDLEDNVGDDGSECILDQVHKAISDSYIKAEDAGSFINSLPTSPVSPSFPSEDAEVAKLGIAGYLNKYGGVLQSQVQETEKNLSNFCNKYINTPHIADLVEAVLKNVGGEYAGDANLDERDRRIARIVMGGARDSWISTLQTHVLALRFAREESERTLIWHVRSVLASIERLAKAEIRAHNKLLKLSADVEDEKFMIWQFAQGKGEVYPPEFVLVEGAAAQMIISNERSAKSEVAAYAFDELYTERQQLVDITAAMSRPESPVRVMVKIPRGGAVELCLYIMLMIRAKNREKEEADARRNRRLGQQLNLSEQPELGAEDLD